MKQSALAGPALRSSATWERSMNTGSVKRHIDEQLWTLWLKELPTHSSIRRGSPPAVEVPIPVANGDGLPAEQRDSISYSKLRGRDSPIHQRLPH